MTTRRPILLLDVLDTLVHDPFFDEVLAWLGLDLTALLAVKDKQAWFDFEAGTIDEATYLARFYLDRRPFDGAELKACLRRSYRWLDGVEPVLGELRERGYAMHALSNYPPWYRMIEEKLGLRRYLEWSFVSCDTGHRKPARAAFEGAVAALGVSAADCLLVDDRPQNCEAARAAGLDAIRFVGASDLRAELDRRGLLDAPTAS